MKLLLVSDLHLEFSGLDLPDPGAFDIAVLAGDIACPGDAVADWVRASPVLQRAKAVILVPGNHEYYDGVLQPRATAMRRAARRLQVPPLQLLDGDEVVVEGVRFLGCTLWTDFELHIDTADGPVCDRERGLAAARRVMADYRAITIEHPAAAGHGTARRRLRAEDTLALHRAQRDWLRRALAQPFDGPTVVVTHHGPHRGSLAPQHAADWVSTAYISELPPSFFEVPRLWVHGHTHGSCDYRVGACRVLCNPRGYQMPGQARPENPHFDPALVVSIDTQPSRAVAVASLRS